MRLETHWHAESRHLNPIPAPHSPLSAHRPPLPAPRSPLPVASPSLNQYPGSGHTPVKGSAGPSKGLYFHSLGIFGRIFRMALAHPFLVLPIKMVRQAALFF